MLQISLHLGLKTAVKFFELNKSLNEDVSRTFYRNVNWELGGGIVSTIKLGRGGGVQQAS